MEKEELMEKYFNKFKDLPPFAFGMPKSEEYDTLMEKAIQRGSPITNEELREMLKDSEPFDLVKKGEALEKNIKKGLK